jgi:hypothetical protein
LSWIRISLCLIAPWKGGNVKYHWGSKKSKCQATHYTSFTLTYLMENKMSLAHHIVEWWGCGYTYENGKSLSARTRGHLMLKHNSKLMQMEWK